MENIDKPNLDGQAGPTTDVTNAANLDALAAPEGNYNSDIDGATMLSDEASLLDSSNDEHIAPNIDNTMNVDNAAAAVDSTKDIPTSDYWSKPFEDLKARNEDFEIPGDLSEENYMDYLKDALSVPTDNTSEIHPDLMKIQNALNEGASLTNILSEIQNGIDVINLSDEALLKQTYNDRYNNWDEKKVDAVVEKLKNAGTMELEAERERGRIRNEQEAHLNSLDETAKAERSRTIEAENVERSNQIQDALQTFDKMDNIYGLPLSKADKADFKEYFHELVTPDDSGVAPMFQMLQSNENLVKIAAMIWKGDDKVRSAITSAKESGKESFISKLDKDPKFKSGYGGPHDPTKVDLDALSAPERLV